MLYTTGTLNTQLSLYTTHLRIQNLKTRGTDTSDINNSLSI